jgi:uncharacterized protein YaaQ
MKLLIAVVHNEDASSTMDALNDRGISVTRFASSGGFLQHKNVTLISGIDDDRVEEVLALIKENCRTRSEFMNPMPPLVEPGGRRHGFHHERRPLRKALMTRSEPGGERRIDWLAAGLGLVLAVLTELGASEVWFGGHRGGVVQQGALTLGALIAGGFLAGYLGPVNGSVWNGIVVAIGFIVVGQLAGAGEPVGPLGSGGLDTLGLVVDDVLVLTGGTLGGMLARGARRLITR